MIYNTKNVHKIFSALTLTIIYIKPFTYNNTTFFLLIKHTIIDCIKNLIKHWLTELTHQAFISKIPSQMHPSPITLCLVSFVLSTGVWLIPILRALLMFQGCLIHIDLQDHVPHFDSFILSNIFLCSCLLVFYFARQHFFAVGKELIFFRIFKWSVLVFCRNSVFCFLSS